METFLTFSQFQCHVPLHVEMNTIQINGGCKMKCTLNDPLKIGRFDGHLMKWWSIACLIFNSGHPSAKSEQTQPRTTAVGIN